MDYLVVFDAAEQGFRYSLLFCLSATVGMATGIIWLVVDRRYARRRWWLRRVGPYLWLGCLATILSVGLGKSLHDQRQLADALRKGEYEIVEGEVVDFVPMPYDGGARESFVVGGHRYDYSDWEATAGFNNTQSHGGPIRQGVRVRIADVGGEIARLEIARRDLR